ncbi:MAG: putative dsRNA-binding protein [Candidatus Omnitrophica bacterium]|nr:putative dsRNA-binding protein [Candidatus Omnitrophota bacterium]
MQKLEKIIGYKFKNKKILLEALTHPSFFFKESYERLEFIGDLILDAIVGIYIYKKYKDKDEEYLTNLKSAYVNKNYLKKVADKIGVIKYSKYVGEPPNRTDKFLEAIIGAIYLDGGWKNAEKFIKKFILNTQLEPLRDYKNLILNYARKIKGVIPEYEITEIKGPPHKREYEVKVKIKGIRNIGKGKSSSLKEAEILAAKSLYEKIIKS